MASSKVPSPSESPPAEMEGPIPDETDDHTDMPLTLATSVLLTSLPKDASAALEGAGDIPQAKVTVLLQPIASAPELSKSRFKISSTQHFSAVISFLRKKITPKTGESLFCYVNNKFAPSGDEVIGNLWRCFKTRDELQVQYAMTPAFG